jgi:hypothetical protein
VPEVSKKTTVASKKSSPVERRRWRVTSDVALVLARIRIELERSEMQEHGSAARLPNVRLMQLCFIAEGLIPPPIEVEPLDAWRIEKVRSAITQMKSGPQERGAPSTNSS